MELAGSAPLIDALVNDLVGNWGTIAAETSFPENLASSVRKCDKKPGLDHESTVFAGSRRLQEQFLGYDHGPVCDRFAPVSRRSAVPGAAASEGPATIVEPKYLPARLIHEPTVRARCKRQPTRS